MGKGTFGCVKWLLTLFNLLFLVCGLAICGLGVWMLVSPSTIYEIVGKNLAPIISYILLTIGGSIVLISFCGCAGAGLENRCLLCLFFTVLCGIFVACLVASVLVAIFKKDITNITSDRLSYTLENTYGTSDAWTDFWDQIQSRFMCCGIKDVHVSSVYQKTAWYKKHTPKQLPMSCCAVTPQGNYANTVQCERGVTNSIHKSGCMNTIMGILVQRSTAILVLLIIVALVLILGMILSLAHLRNIINCRYAEYSHPI